jgi:hypothetical protein
VIRLKQKVAKEARFFMDDSYGKLVASLDAGHRSTLISPGQEINQSAQRMQKENHDEPKNLFGVAEALAGNDIHQHPDPEGKKQDGQHQADQPQ